MLNENFIHDLKEAEILIRGPRLGKIDVFTETIQDKLFLLADIPDSHRFSYLISDHYLIYSRKSYYSDQTAQANLDNFVRIC